VIVFHAGALTKPTAACVEALARVQLAARRRGRRIVLCHAPEDLRDLLHLMGLAEILPCREELRVEPRGQPEQREPARGVEEEDDPADAIAREVDDLE
jgi:hypothetical protein